MIKKAVCLILILALCIAAGCKKNEPAVVDVLNDGGSAVVEITPNAEGEVPADAVAEGASVKVTATVAYVFNCTEGVTLYGAAEYINTGSVPVRLSEAIFSFTVGNELLPHQFTPILNQYDIVQPGQSSYVAMWFKDDLLTAGTPATLAASFKCEAAGSARNDITVGDLFLADNYPGFTTLSGTLTNASDEACSLNMIYAAFYDESGKLLGVWHFTRNAMLESGDEKTFVVNMTELPIAGLAASAAECRGTGFGFN